MEANVEVVPVQWAVIGEVGDTIGIVEGTADPATEYTAVVYAGFRRGKPVIVDRKTDFATVGHAAKFITDYHYPTPVVRMR